MRRLRCRTLLWLGLLGIASAATAAGGQPPRRTLFILLDAVPFGLVERLTDPAREGGPLLKGFSRPAPLVSSFPSSTSVAAGGLLEPAGLERSPGYEARFFDWDDLRVRGGGPISYFRIDFPWREFFDWSGKGVVRSAVGALRPVKASIFRVEKGIEAFFEAEDPEFFVYLEMTDTAAHLKGPESLEVVFARLEAALDEGRRAHPEMDFRVVLFSDHGISGGEPLSNVWRPVRRALEGGGYRIRRRLEDPRDLVLTPFGLVSSFEVYTRPENRREVAALLAGVDGVDLCTCPGDDGWWVEGEEGSAVVTRTATATGSTWEYRPLSGDPLGYEPIVSELQRRAGDPQRRRFPDRWWFEATGTVWYPDALHRIARAFDLVENPASILCSLDPGFMYGLDKTEFLARVGQGRLRWTHGALHRAASLGFLATDDPDWQPPPAVRFDRGLVPFLRPRLSAR